MYDDGRVTLTIHKKAPTMLVRLVPGLHDVTVASATATVKASDF